MAKKYRVVAPLGRRFAAMPDDKLADTLDSALNPIRQMEDGLKAAGVSKNVIKSLKDRLERRAQPFMTSGKNLTNAALLKEIEGKLELLIHHIDEYSVSTADLKSIAYATDVLNKHRNLLMGQPTAITSFAHAESLKKLLPALLEECKRRGMEIDLSRDQYQEEEDGPAAA